MDRREKSALYPSFCSVVSVSAGNNFDTPLQLVAEGMRKTKVAQAVKSGKGGGAA